jgi:ADP-ribose pyrophosphatase YjhB (NUDIX family)
MKDAVVAVAERSGLVLGISRKFDPNQWGLIGGMVEPNEALVDAIAREFYEETKIKVDVNDFYDLSFQRKSDSGRCLVHAFSIRENLVEKFPPPSSSHEGLVTWVTWADLFRGPFGNYNVELFKFLYLYLRGG